ncbi:DUF2244 domain-containing protein [Luteithermobacter gelatinilyticus]|uniref:DUF2244 domain-containing protein n=1 Tax=Luteithermobacter gelatinilyticus TaxID=2582913 RepID=UPI001105FBAF|nr:DUF2244 domain-containing protein [Luteithermobacter gelatinilyticus]
MAQKKTYPPSAETSPPSPAVPPPPGTRVWFDAVLYPHRSLSPRGFVILMSLVALVSFSVGAFFFLRGAWPVFGFMGLDVLLIYGAFKLNYRSGNCVEQVRLAGDELLVRRIDHKGSEQSWSFNPYWVNVNLQYRAQDAATFREKHILVTSHGRGLFIGTFLTQQERREVLGELKKALRAYKTAPVAERLVSSGAGLS